MAEVTPFQQRVYALTKKVPSGAVTTYKDIAGALRLRCYRAVGQALHKNPFAPVVPCHRVVTSDGSLGGFAHGCAAKQRLLEAEGIKIRENKILDFQRVKFSF